MTEQEVLNGNKLIAIFMGWMWQPDSTFYPNGILEDGESFQEPEELEYLTSWDALMPVVHRIKYGNPYTKTVYLIHQSELSHESNMRFKAIRNELLNLSITNVWFCVVGFITWYNSQQ